MFKKELGGLHCRWKTYHQKLDRSNEMKNLQRACEKPFAMFIICLKAVLASDVTVSL